MIIFTIIINKKYNIMSNEELLARIEALETRIQVLESPSSRVAPEGVNKTQPQPVDENIKPYYAGWACQSVRNYGEYVVNDGCIKKEYGPAMFDGIYYIISQMVSLEKLRMISNSGNPLDFSLTILPDIRKIRNSNVKEMKICAGFEFIPYLENFPALLRLEIVDHPLRSSVNRDQAKKQKIYDYCQDNGIALLCKISE
jgi:hypothetical protein